MMGIVNVTPDSFSDGGQWLDVDAAKAHALAMVAAGATWIDIGGESTRPGAPAVSAEEECARVLPEIERLQAAPGRQVRDQYRHQQSRRGRKRLGCRRAGRQRRIWRA